MAALLFTYYAFPDDWIDALSFRPFDNAQLGIPQYLGCAGEFGVINRPSADYYRWNIY